MFYPEAGEAVTVLETTVSAVGSRAPGLALPEPTTVITFVDRQATSRCPLGETGHLAVEITPLVLGGHRGIEDRATTGTLGALHVEKDQPGPPSARAPAAGVPGATARR